MYGSLLPPPHELLTMCGRRSGRGLLPELSVGAKIHWPAARREASLQKKSSQPLAAIHCALGATPTWLPSWSSPTMVPITCVPCATLSQGVSPQVPDGSNQLYW